MTDQFEKWLENRIEFATKQTKEELGLPYFHSVSGRKKAFEDALSQYREFLKKPTPKEHPLVFWGGIYHKWDETKKRFIPQFVARRLK